MVRLINNKNVGKVANLVYGFLKFQMNFTRLIELNNPYISPCIYVMWHENQFCLYGVKNKKQVNVLVSNSFDGEIITRAIEKIGFSVVRGSSNKKGCVTATMQLISKLKDGENVAIMVDGPRGPLHRVKGGAIKLAKTTGAPIIPVHWFSPQKNFISLPSWDKMKTPIFNCDIISMYGEPIYANETDSNESIAEKIRTSLENLEKSAPEEFKKAKKMKLWNKKK